MLTHEPQDGDKATFRRRTYLLFPFQKRYALAIVLLTVFVTGVVSLVCFGLLRRVVPGSFEALRAEGFDRNLQWLLAWIGVLIASSFVFFYFLVILVSHRVAGPIAVMTRYMSEFANGRYPQIRELRKNDELQELCKLFKSAVERFKNRDLEEIQLLRSELQKLKGLKLGPSVQPLESSIQLLIDRRLQTTDVGPDATSSGLANP